jgi:type 1 fimbria pilin
MKRRLCALAAVLVLVMTMTAHAAPARTPRPNGSLTFNGTTATCSTTLSDYGKELDVELQLWQGSTLVASWPASGTSKVSVEGTCQVTKGQTYSLVVTGTAGSSDFSITLATKTC